MAENEHAVAQRGQEKFQFYLVALTFTVLGLSIQTADFDSGRISAIFEVLGWFCLLVSGLTGLSYLEWNPVIRVKVADQDDLQKRVEDLRQKSAAGLQEIYVLQRNETVPIETQIQEYQDHLDKLGNLIKKIERKALIKYGIFKWAFLAGMLCLAIARSYGPITTVILACEPNTPLQPTQ